MGIIEELWYGDMFPWEKPITHNEKYNEVLERLVKLEEELDNRLNNEDETIFEKFTNAQGELMCITEREAFVRGFILGARIIIEVMNTEIG